MSVDQSIVEQVQALYGLNQEYFQKQTVQDKTMDGRARRVTVNGFPGITVYHLRYDADGRVTDHHIDTWYKDPGGLIKKLAAVYGPEEVGAGRPIWVLKLPGGYEPPAPTIRCSHPSCGMAKAPSFFTEEQRDVHMMSVHREWMQLQERRRERENRQEELAAMRAQVETLTAAVAEMMKRGAKT